MATAQRRLATSSLEPRELSPTLRVAVAQTQVCGDVPTAEVLRSAGNRVRAQMRRAAEEGARVVHFPEGTLSHPNKRLISNSAPEVANADWSLVDWTVLRAELESVGRESRRLGLWTVLGAPHQLTGNNRPHNSLFTFSDRGALVTRYDKRRLSTSEGTFLYTAGNEAVVVDVDGFRLGLAVCVEILFPEIFVEYVELGADVVLVSSAPSPAFGLLAEAHAVMNSVAISLSVAAFDGADSSPSGVCSSDGWMALCNNGAPGVVVADVPKRIGPSFHQQARAGLYDGHCASGDPRSLDRTTL